MTGSQSDVLDTVNRRLLQELHRDPRVSMAALARRVGMSAPSVTSRVQRLKDDGVILGFRMDVDPVALGMAVTAFARHRPGPGAGGPGGAVTECHRITGEDCFLVELHAPTVADLGQTLDRFQLYGTTVTSIVVATPVPARSLPVPDDGP